MDSGPTAVRSESQAAVRVPGRRPAVPGSTASESDTDGPPAGSLWGHAGAPEIPVHLAPLHLPPKDTHTTSFHAKG